MATHAKALTSLLDNLQSSSSGTKHIASANDSKGARK